MVANVKHGYDMCPLGNVNLMFGDLTLDLSTHVKAP
jgi:hypothetical protein